MRDFTKSADERIVTEAGSAMLCAPELAADARMEWLDLDWWRERGGASEIGGGRGGVAVVETPAGEGVLRHYRRGGMLAAMRGDRYRWSGADRTRSFAEFRLLRRLAAIGLPVPQAIAARYQRQGGHYTADILTRRITAARTLGECVGDGTLDEALAARVGALLARFHRVGVFHADLNAHNVLVSPEGLHLIDFDRGRLRKPGGAWPHANLRRLRRSLLKLGAAGSDPATLDATLWHALEQSWREAMAA